ncbi:phage distal tail protein, Rcc01695 family [Hyphomonas sp. NPDC076900]|uniref:phage distal tail protein, Rcc01695 family n=1 Tax=unclassified Hyphomonas TaxID=2630699 RepID=UPI003D0724D7
MSLALFHEVSLPIPLALAANGGPERRVETVTLAGGQEARNATWAGSRRRWDIGSAAARVETLHALIAFFEARGGRLHGFRFRDMLDDRSGALGTEVSPVDQAIGVGDGAEREFALVKHYGGWARRIWKPVAGSVRVAVDGAEGGFALDAATGLVTLAEAPAAGAVVTAGFRFDCPVRFDTDRLDVTLEGFGAGRAIRVPLVEIIG